MAKMSTKRIRPGPATQQYVNSSLWMAERAREAHGEAAAALEETVQAARVLHGLGGSDERARLALETESAANRALAAVRAAEVRVQDVAAYLRHLSGDAENSREALALRLRAAQAEPRVNERRRLNGNGAA
jgi:hypothetical protein